MDLLRCLWPGHGDDGGHGHLGTAAAVCLPIQQDARAMRQLFLYEAQGFLFVPS